MESRSGLIVGNVGRAEFASGAVNATAQLN
jgi:hypothetical protein